MAYLWFITSLCAFILTCILINKTLKKFSWANIAWIVSFMLFTYSAFGSWMSYIYGWTPMLYKSWYFAAALLVAFMGLGQILLLKWQKTSLVLATYIIVVSTLMLLAIIQAAVDPQIIAQSGEIGGTGLPSDVRKFSPLLTIFGSLALLGGSLYSAIKFRSRAGLLVFIGAIVLASGGTLVRMDFHIILPIANLIGILLIYVGAIYKPLSSLNLSPKQLEVAK